MLGDTAVALIQKYRAQVVVIDERRHTDFIYISHTVTTMQDQHSNTSRQLLQCNYYNLLAHAVKLSFTFRYQCYYYTNTTSHPVQTPTQKFMLVTNRLLRRYPPLSTTPPTRYVIYDTYHTTQRTRRPQREQRDQRGGEGREEAEALDAVGSSPGH